MILLLRIELCILKTVKAFKNRINTNLVHYRESYCNAVAELLIRLFIPYPVWKFFLSEILTYCTEKVESQSRTRKPESHTNILHRES